MTERTLIIAEAGVNHNGSRDKALALVDAATRAGADIVKFQSFKADRVAAPAAPKAAYQAAATGTEQSQADMLRALELSEALHFELAGACAASNIEFMSTPFDTESADFLAQAIGVKRMKIASGELTNAPLLLHVARLGLSIILSTGMATLDEIADALAVIAFGLAGDNGGLPTREALAAAARDPAAQAALRGRVVLLHCTTEYPAPPSSINLKAMETLRRTFGLPVGLSDHSEGIHFAVAAAALGAQVVEKHFTLDRTLPGPDHRASIEPDELVTMVRNIRDIEAGLGDGRKQPAPEEIGNRAIARRSLVAAKAIQAGERFTEQNLTAKRPGSGVSPLRYWDYLGRPAGRDYQPNEAVEDI
jgi:N-acetylneuraminate synthase